MKVYLVIKGTNNFKEVPCSATRKILKNVNRDGILKEELRFDKIEGKELKVKLNDINPFCLFSWNGSVYEYNPMEYAKEVLNEDLHFVRLDISLFTEEGIPVSPEDYKKSLLNWVRNQKFPGNSAYFYKYNKKTIHPRHIKMQ